MIYVGLFIALCVLWYFITEAIQIVKNLFAGRPNWEALVVLVTAVGSILWIFI
jgi:hypothetical protein